MRDLILAATPDAGIEASFKMHSGDIRADRLLIAVDRDKIAPKHLSELLDVLAMPAELKSDFIGQMTHANKIGFGLDRQKHSTVLKVYLEFWDQLIAELGTEVTRHQPRTLFIGYKWDTARSRRTAVDRYICYPLLTVTGIVRRVGLIFGESAPAGVVAAIRALIEHAAIRLTQDAFVYTEVRSQGHSRRSFDINLYKSGFCIEDVAGMLRTLGEGIGAPPEPLRAVINRYAENRLGHLSGGWDRDGTPFVTLYVEVDGPA